MSTHHIATQAQLKKLYREVFMAELPAGTLDNMPAIVLPNRLHRGDGFRGTIVSYEQYQAAVAREIAMDNGASSPRNFDFSASQRLNIILQPYTRMNDMYGEQFGVNFLQIRAVAEDAIRRLEIDPMTGNPVGE